MNKIISRVALVLALAMGCIATVSAAEGGYPWDKFPQEKLADVPALQNGAKLFVNYCLNCHSAAFMRYDKLRDLDLSANEVKENLMFTSEKLDATMKVSLDPADAKAWFGTLPPDLTLITRSRSAPGKGSGADYLYTYLRTFYRDDTKPTGWNNLALPDVAMPNVLWELQGQRAANFVDVKDPHDPAHTTRRFEGFEQLSAGSLNARQYDSAVGDLVAYLQWMGEPAQGSRVRIGIWVVFFMALLIVVTWRLNAAYWRYVK